MKRQGCFMTSDITTVQPHHHGKPTVWEGREGTCGQGLPGL